MIDGDATLHQPLIIDRPCAINLNAVGGAVVIGVHIGSGTTEIDGGIAQNSAHARGGGKNLSQSETIGNRATGATLAGDGSVVAGRRAAKGFLPCDPQIFGISSCSFRHGDIPIARDIGRAVKKIHGNG